MSRLSKASLSTSSQCALLFSAFSNAFRGGCTLRVPAPWARSHVNSAELKCIKYLGRLVISVLVVAVSRYSRLGLTPSLFAHPGDDRREREFVTGPPGPSVWWRPAVSRPKVVVTACRTETRSAPGKMT